VQSKGRSAGKCTPFPCRGHEAFCGPSSCRSRSMWRWRQSPLFLRASVIWLRVGRPASPFGVAYTLQARSFALTPVGKMSAPLTVMVGEPANPVSVVPEADLSNRICTGTSLRPRAANAACRRSSVLAVLGHWSIWSSSILMNSLSTVHRPSLLSLAPPDRPCSLTLLRLSQRYGGP
jgi:hypothetical protein